MQIDTGMYDRVYKSWESEPFRYMAATEENGRVGLRKPQMAALYTTLGHLVATPTVTATVVMPTGTGKTDTILALIIAGRFKRTLIIVPSDALRKQTLSKCQQLKTLRAIGSIREAALNPVVNTIESKMAVEDIEKLAEANIIIATPQALQRFNVDELSALTALCSHLVVDEAHHVAAETWGRIRKAFAGNPCIQFTATPFREDKKALEGKIIYNYPLKDAQIEGYFKTIEFHPVREYNLELADQAVAAKAVELLRADLAAGYDHLMLVRARAQTKAEELFDIYKEFKEFNPVLIHSKVKNKGKVLEAIVRKEHRIIVCVDMLGEGFDLPELKIAAIHDQHRSPAVTLQFIGRLTRVDDRLGDAKFVANIANQKIDTQMAALYKESADWSSVIRDVSHEKIEKEIRKEEFAAQFEEDDDASKILALNPNPKISAVAYHLPKDQWRPVNIEKFSSNKEKLFCSTVSDDFNTVMMVTRAETTVGWANTSDIFNVEWVLYLAFYNAEDLTLFVHCSGDDNQASRFLNLISKDAVKIMGEPTFRTLHDINFIKLQNVGLSRARKDLRFTMHVGRDINNVISEIESGTARKSNIFATGFESGEKTTVGCSHKGKIWEMNSSSVDYWVQWCKRAALKLNDPNINLSDTLQHVMRSEKIIDVWPPGLFYADWPEAISIESEQKISIAVNGEVFNLLDTKFGKPVCKDQQTLEIPLLAILQDDSEKLLATISILLLPDGYKYSCPDAKLTYTSETPLSAYLDSNPLVLLKTDGSMVEGNYRYFSPITVNIKLPVALIEAWDWKTTRIHKESMRADAVMDTVQGFTFQKISDLYDIVFNDDGSGEIADLIGIREEKGLIIIDLYHCKFCPQVDGSATPGARLSDVYEVCGQASRSIKWLHTGEKFFERLMYRYQKSFGKGFDRLLKGEPIQIDLLRNKCHDNEIRYGFNIVQPAISAEKVSGEQLTVLGASYTYIKGISGVDLKVIVSR